MKQPSRTESRDSGLTALSTVPMSSTVPVLTLAVRGTVDLSSLSPGIVVLTVGLVLSFLAPVVVASILIAADGHGTDDGRSTATGTANESPSATRTDRSTDVRRESTRAHAERQER